MDDPDPATAESLDELAACLRRLRIHAGNPTYRALELKTIHASEFLPGTQLRQVRLTRSVLSDVLKGQKFPGKAFLLTFVDACGIDVRNEPRWEQAWDRLAIQYLDQAGQGETEQLRQQLAEAQARADQAVREADKLRLQLGDARKPEETRPASIPFWDVLEPTEREMLRSVASVRTFAARATIMQQGEPADYVIVILGGRASIRVNENGRERVLAERGPGQLIGERAALQVSVRSASVVALEMIQALAVQTRDFASFISANPRILTFVQQQSHDRGTDKPDVHDQRDPTGSRAASVGGTATGQPNGSPGANQKPLRGETCIVVITDVVAFGARKRTDEDRLIIREALSGMTKLAMRGLPAVRSEDRGDGILIVVPNVPAETVIDQLLRVLPSALDQHNNTQRNPAQIQLRLSVDVGPVVSDTMGVSGAPLISAARLIEAPAFREAFIGSTARLGVIVSHPIYEMAIKHNRDHNYLASYSEVPVEVKETSTTAWMMLIG